MAKILVIAHGYPPQQLAGAEFYLQEMNAYLTKQGHEIVICLDSNPDLWVQEVEWADVIFTHLDRSQAVTDICQQLNKPCINIIHHNWEIPHLRQTRPNVYSVYNSEWVQKDRGYPHPSLVVRPPVDPSRFRDISYNSNGYVTLVNCNEHKGARIFQKIARGCPDLRFLAVKGHHGPQIALSGRNMTQWECQEDIRKVLEVTAILLVPSVYESYGRIGIEAMACGIPVIASDTPGLRESLGDMGKFASRNFIPGWMQILRTVNKGTPDALKAHADDTWQQSLKELSALNDLINKITQP